MTEVDRKTLLEVEGLTTVLEDREGTVAIVDDVSLHIDQGETLALVGESGCGKSLTALSLLRLVDEPLRIAGGKIRLRDQELLSLCPAAMRAVRGKQISMIFQEPMTALNPVLTVGNQVVEVLRLHEKMNGREARLKTIDLFREVGIPDPERRIDEYPHRLSGGMRQRVMIAMALACDPQLLIADEPTTALDVTVQAQILDLLRHCQEERGMAILLITHDLGVVAELAHRVSVMYAGRIVEEAPAEELYSAPSHPYTEALFRSIPKLHGPVERLQSITGSVPAPRAFPAGCRFHPRCPEKEDRCSAERPPLQTIGDGRRAACVRRGPKVGGES